MKTFITFVLSLNVVLGAYTDIKSNHLFDDDAIGLGDGDLYLLQDKQLTRKEDKVSIKLFYECHCPSCMEFESTDFKETVEKLNEYLDIQTYPYGNAKTHEHDGKTDFECQHGPKECYGNKLHACALEIVKNHTAALLFNSCMMGGSQKGWGSDDKAADKCASNMGIDSKPIKTCAKGNKGSELLKYYGEESKKVGFHYVPYVLLNGAEYTGEHFLQDVCAKFSSPPPPCRA
ncbi:unnamed protein product [Leptosia nina]|uniref:Gamma-interferon-inducible lysosomal thiol reductase n=1 Tax=Leptosia nina TaxID=320188 RepID=A0AAV1IS52_9NEOP